MFKPPSQGNTGPSASVPLTKLPTGPVPTVGFTFGENDRWLLFSAIRPQSTEIDGTLWVRQKATGTYREIRSDLFGNSYYVDGAALSGPSDVAYIVVRSPSQPGGPRIFRINLAEQSAQLIATADGLKLLDINGPTLAVSPDSQSVVFQGSVAPTLPPAEETQNQGEKAGGTSEKESEEAPSEGFINYQLSVSGLSTRQKSKRVDWKGERAFTDEALEVVEAETEEADGPAAMFFEGDGLLFVEPKPGAEGPEDGGGQENQ